ncbi:MAG: hypothetical protein CSA94_02445 [Bacteroidetes bacterium]|nr:MAG: hypothetical protein CSA94_02445 [Bacteroidota bacterium]
MTQQEFEEENKKIRDKIYSINRKIQILSEEKRCLFYDSSKESVIEALYSTSNHDITKYVRERNIYHEILALSTMKKSLEERLNQSKKKREREDGISNIISKLYLPNFPDMPKQIYPGNGLSKPIYSVSDGCLAWMFVFVIIGIAIIALTV